jgi:hypothetical protein
MEEWGIKENVGVHECNIVSFKNSTMYLQHNNKNLLKLKWKNFVVFCQMYHNYTKDIKNSKPPPSISYLRFLFSLPR